MKLWIMTVGVSSNDPAYDIPATVSVVSSIQDDTTPMEWFLSKPEIDGREYILIHSLLAFWEVIGGDAGLMERDVLYADYPSGRKTASDPRDTRDDDERWIDEIELPDGYELCGDDENDDVVYVEFHGKIIGEIIQSEDKQGVMYFGKYYLSPKRRAAVNGNRHADVVAHRIIEKHTASQGNDEITEPDLRLAVKSMPSKFKVRPTANGNGDYVVECEGRILGELSITYKDDGTKEGARRWLYKEKGLKVICHQLVKKVLQSLNLRYQQGRCAL